MRAPSVLTLALCCLMLGGTAGSMYQTYTSHYRNMEAMTGRYLAEKAWLDARTAELIAEVEHYATEVKKNLKKKKEIKKHGK
ncbi:MAG: hypothetical protein PHO83_03745 [Geobacteraceae bacterium]|nr:hypothetical protein [Geobacteraceae bacterium]